MTSKFKSSIACARSMIAFEALDELSFARSSHQDRQTRYPGDIFCKVQIPHVTINLSISESFPPGPSSI